MAQPGWQVHKFGGTSMGDADCFRRVADILLADPAERQAVVVSAMSKTTLPGVGVTLARVAAPAVRLILSTAQNQSLAALVRRQSTGGAGRV